MHTNFFNNIHTTLLSRKNDELIVWPGINGKSKSYTGNNLLNRIGGCRVALEKEGVSSGANVLLAIPVSIDLICALLAIQSMGAVPILPPANASATELLSIIKKLKIKVVAVGKLPSLVLRVVASLKSFRFAVVQNVAVENPVISVANVPEDRAALISHSSGSTAAAKSIYRSHKVLLAQHNVLKKVFPPWALQRDFPLFPNILLHNLSLGVVSIMPNIPGFKLSNLQPEKIIDQLNKERVDTLTGNVYYFMQLLDYVVLHSVTFPNVKAVGIGGSPVPERLVTALKAIFINATIYIIYGSSEAEPIAVRKVNEEIIEPLAGYKVGKVNEHLQLKIIPVGNVKAGGKTYSVGEITVTGDHVAIDQHQEVLQTGDFGYLDEQGELYLTARKGNEQICNGLQHYQLEHLLMDDSRVEKVAVITNDNSFAVYVQGSLTKQEIRNILGEHLPEQLIKSINKRNSLPVDARHLSKILYTKVS